jgi:hypothetical protein
MSVTRRHMSRNNQWSAMFESVDHENQLLWTTKRVIKFPTPGSPLDTLGEIALSDSETQALAD